MDLVRAAAIANEGLKASAGGGAQGRSARARPNRWGRNSGIDVRGFSSELEWFAGMAAATAAKRRVGDDKFYPGRPQGSSGGFLARGRNGGSKCGVRPQSNQNLPASESSWRSAWLDLDTAAHFGGGGRRPSDPRRRQSGAELRLCGVVRPFRLVGDCIGRGLH